MHVKGAETDVAAVSDLTTMLCRLMLCIGWLADQTKLQRYQL